MAQVEDRKQVINIFKHILLGVFLLLLLYFLGAFLVSRYLLPPSGSEQAEGVALLEEIESSIDSSSLFEVSAKHIDSKVGVTGYKITIMLYFDERVDIPPRLLEIVSAAKADLEVSKDIYLDCLEGSPKTKTVRFYSKKVK